MVLKKCVENFEPNPNLARRGAVNETGNQLQPFPDLRLLGGTLGAGQGGAEVLLQGHRPAAAGLFPSLKKAERRETVFLLLPDSLLAGGQVILDGGHDQHVRPLRHAQCLTKKVQVRRERIKPPSTLPRDGPSLVAQATANWFHQHSSLRDGPFAHALIAA